MTLDQLIAPLLQVPFDSPVVLKDDLDNLLQIKSAALVDGQVVIETVRPVMLCA